MTGRVHWKDEERDKVSFTAAEIFRNSAGLKTWRQALIDAQYQVLAPHRLRPANSIKTIPKVDLDAMKARGDELLAEQDEVRRVERARIEQEAAEAERLRLEAEETAKQKALQQPTPQERLMLLLGERADEVTNLLVEMIEARLEERLGGTIKKVFERVNMVAQKEVSRVLPPSERRPKVLIVGMLGKHELPIHRDFDEYFEITFVDTNKITNLKERAALKDYVIINTNFINHAVQDAVRKHPGLYLASGNNAVSERLLELAVQLHQKEPK